ncbi:MAG: 2-oxoacid:acceptor oxidoreductase subunit alpha [Candidatus Odinarchaeota archaeon]|nr:2-oxoacid:acceptor oxidoreductase subunit alpha [Candidatus Odinarchaeota archaeon]
MPPGVYFVQGDFACAEGAIMAGMRFFAGYPITPATEIAERLSKRLPEVGGIYIQFEDEMASMAAIIGASYTGLKAMTATSGPGFSLMQENIGLACMVEAPVVIVNVMRRGPSTGIPTEPSQGDIMQSRWGSHGDKEIIAIAPSYVQEMFDFMIDAFNYSETYRVPVIVLSDAMIAHLREKLVIPSHEEIKRKIVKRKKPSCPPEEYLPFKPDPSDLVPPMANFGDGYNVYVTGLAHDERGYPSSDSEVYERLVKRLCDKIRKNRRKIVKYESLDVEDADVVIVCYGSVARPSMSVVSMMRRKGYKVGMLRLKTVWPFPYEYLETLSEEVKFFVVPEMNYVQIGREVRYASKGADVYPIPELSKNLPSPKKIYSFVRDFVEKKV